MDLQSLLQKLNAIENSAVEENCGSSMPVAPQTPPTMPPSMSVNLNAQGMDNIEDLLKLITKVNSSMPASPSPMPALDAPAPKMSGAADDMKSFITKLGPMDEPEKEDFSDATTHPEPEIKDISASIPSGDDLHKKKTMHKAAAGGDNPMAMEDIKLQLEALLSEIKSK